MSEPASRFGATIADLLAIPEDERRHEIIDGVLVRRKMPLRAGTVVRSFVYPVSSDPTIVELADVRPEAGGSPPRSRSSSRTIRS